MHRAVQNGGHPHLPQQWLQQIWQSITSELGLLVNCCPVVLDEVLEFIKRGLGLYDSCPQMRPELFTAHELSLAIRTLCQDRDPKAPVSCQSSSLSFLSNYSFRKTFNSFIDSAFWLCECAVRPLQVQFAQPATNKQSWQSFYRTLPVVPKLHLII